MCWRAGWEVRPYALPGLQRERILPLVPEEPSLYLSRDIKRISDAELNKTSFTRMVGAAYCAGNCYAVYNTRKAAMKWNGMGEFKTVHSLAEISRLNAGIGNVDSAILFGASEGVALQSFSEKSKEQKKDLRPDVVFSHIHFVPLDENGVRQLQFFTIPDWKERLLSLLFDPETRSFNRSSFEYDAQVDGTFVLSHLDGDLARLIRFKEGIEGRTGPFEVLCFPHQVDFLREYLAGRAVIKTIEMDAVEAALGIEKRDAFE